MSTFCRILQVHDETGNFGNNALLSEMERYCSSYPNVLQCLVPNSFCNILIFICFEIPSWGKSFFIVMNHTAIAPATNLQRWQPLKGWWNCLWEHLCCENLLKQWSILSFLVGFKHTSVIWMEKLVWQYSSNGYPGLFQSLFCLLQKKPSLFGIFGRFKMLKVLQIKDDAEFLLDVVASPAFPWHALEHLNLCLTNCRSIRETGDVRFLVKLNPPLLVFLRQREGANCGKGSTRGNNFQQSRV